MKDEMSDQAPNEPFRSWAIVEIFGHERIAGEVSEQTIGGGTFIRVDVPAVNGQQAFTRFYGDKAIYSIQPVSEDIACRAAASMHVRPVNVYLLPEPKPVSEEDRAGMKLADDLEDDRPDDDDEDGSDDDDGPESPF
jgi:hypothetical protein